MLVELAAAQTFASAATGKQVPADSFLPHSDAIEADFNCTFLSLSVIIA
jgi:hypothetical protein